VVSFVDSAGYEVVSFDVADYDVVDNEVADVVVCFDFVADFDNYDFVEILCVVFDVVCVEIAQSVDNCVVVVGETETEQDVKLEIDVVDVVEGEIVVVVVVLVVVVSVVVDVAGCIDFVEDYIEEDLFGIDAVVGSDVEIVEE